MIDIYAVQILAIMGEEWDGWFPDSHDEDVNDHIQDVDSNIVDVEFISYLYNKKQPYYGPDQTPPSDGQYGHDLYDQWMADVIAFEEEQLTENFEQMSLPHEQQEHGSDPTPDPTPESPSAASWAGTSDPVPTPEPLSVASGVGTVHDDTDVVMTNAAPAGDLASACVPEVAAAELHVAPPADDLACARCVTARSAESTELDFECEPDPVFPPTVSVLPPTVCLARW